MGITCVRGLGVELAIDDTLDERFPFGLGEEKGRLVCVFAVANRYQTVFDCDLDTFRTIPTPTRDLKVFIFE